MAASPSYPPYPSQPLPPAAKYQAIAEAVTRMPPRREEAIAALGLVPELRKDLDGIERSAIDTARRAGASWTQIAAALGLGSRQAAEQRRLRLGPMGIGRDATEARLRRNRQRTVDNAAGERIVALRRAVEELVATIDAVPGWNAQGPLAVLAGQTLRVALDADPGALIDLSRHVLDDLERLGGPPAGGAPVRDAVGRIERLVRRPSPGAGEEPGPGEGPGPDAGAGGEPGPGEGET